MDFGLAITAVDVAIDRAKRLKELAKQIENVEFRAVIVELQEAILDVKEQNLSLRGKRKTISVLEFI